MFEALITNFPSGKTLPAITNIITCYYKYISVYVVFSEHGKCSGCKGNCRSHYMTIGTSR
jgi:hypothetical protein